MRVSHALCSMLPKMSELFINSKPVQSIKPLTAFTWLSSPDFMPKGEVRYGLSLDMSLLPLNLVILSLASYSIDSTGFASLKRVRVPSLSLDRIENAQAGECDLLQSLPKLWVSCLNAAHALELLPNKHECRNADRLF